MTETTNVHVPAQGGPPLADTSDMAELHQIFRDAIAAAPALIGSAKASGMQRVEMVGTYYDNVLGLLHAHHDGEDAIIWPSLCERAPEHADEIKRIAGQHDAVTGALGSARDKVAAWRASGDAENAAAAAAAVADLGAALLPHLDEEERFIVPLAAQHITAPEWGELPGHAMRHFGGDKLWLILGLVCEQMRPDQIAMMEAHMPPPVSQMWVDSGQDLFEAFVTDLRAS